MKLTASKRIGRLEVKSAPSIGALAEVQRRKKIEAREEWRKTNHEGNRWSMFLALWGPDSDWCYVIDALESSEQRASLAYRDLIRRTLAKYDGNKVNYDAMTPDEGALATIVEEFYAHISNHTLLTTYLSFYGSDLPCNTPYIDLAIKKIDECGLEWLQIAYNDELQKQLEERVFGEDLSDNFMI